MMTDYKSLYEASKKEIEALKEQAGITWNGTPISEIKMPEIAGYKQIIEATVWAESDCEPKDGEFSVYIRPLNGTVINSDTYELVHHEIYESICNGALKIKPEINYRIICYESGESCDVFWDKYFISLPETIITEKWE
ncbi:hypothetical protein [Xenorhabdus hominickii]|uniref:Uncharacterized protein n=1 Tax=Xenorhabdus hominickii TaxID=351679 RepID=A0A2G0Q613_XENHO|nr:hypothetical protein [Xenorhabdus hominickii]AOM39567.1 hypothetical protein A9255_02520 [Xenorhabdus hominickii]PHM54652.1 hypothetical protein Xhom_02602 [Xenorhabdus hominickii]